MSALYISQKVLFVITRQPKVGFAGNIANMCMNNIKKAIIGTGIAATITAGGAGITQMNINSFKADLEVLGIEREQAENIARYFKGNVLVGKKDTITIAEMQSMNRLYNEAVKEFGGEFGQIKDKKDFLKKANKLVEKYADKKSR